MHEPISIEKDLQFTLEWSEALAAWLARHPEAHISHRTAWETLWQIVSSSVVVYYHADAESQLKILLALRECYQILQEEIREPYFTPMANALFEGWRSVLELEERGLN